MFALLLQRGTLYTCRIFLIKMQAS